MRDRIFDRRPLARAVAALIGRPVEQAHSAVGHLVKIEVEVDTLAQLDEALALTPDAILLDNMSVDELRQAAKLVAGRVITEASGRVTAQTAPAICRNRRRSDLDRLADPQRADPRRRATD